MAEEVMLGNLRWGDKGVEELQDGRVIATVARADLHHATIRYGFTAGRPVAQAVFGAVLTILPLPLVLLAVRGVIGLWTVLGMVFVLLGLWVVWDSFQRGYFVELHGAEKMKKLTFGSKIRTEELEGFMAEVRSRFGDVVERG